jgi:hypothetical protein
MADHVEDDRVWTATRDELRRLAGVDVWQAVSTWLDRFAAACLASDAVLAQRLVAEPFAFPDAVVSLSTRFRDTVDALRAGRRADALESLTVDSETVGPLVCAIADAAVIDDAPHAELQEAAAWGLRGIWFEAVSRPVDAGAAFFEAGKRLGWIGTDHEDTALRLLTRATELGGFARLPRRHPTSIGPRSRRASPPGTGVSRRSCPMRRPPGRT